MGDEVLMKKLWIVTLASSLAALYAGDVQSGGERIALIKDYKMMFERIGQQRIGVDTHKIESVHSPFVRLKKEETKKMVVKKDGTKIAVKAKAQFALQAIVNKRAKISGKWYSVGDKVDEFTLASIQSNGIFLENNEFKKRLTLRKKNEKITIK